ncbi:MAG TPA: 5'/3'-nucleotidase SurE [Negativicutes bacterium]|nr:5'/3'-nucleotidase SurE [Negativicutes bacterium]
MRLLLTNDDGIRAPGIRALWESLKDIAEIIVAAPAQQQSATGHSITVYHPIWVNEQTFDDPNISGWRIGGTPADSVKIALDTLMTKMPDLVVSGINHGPNLGTDVLYSGTVSAALEGAMHGIPAIAISLATDGDPDFGPAAEYCRKVVQQIIEKKMPAFSLLNINVPPIPAAEIQGVSITKLGAIEYENAFDKRVDPRGRTYYWMAGTPMETLNSDDTDVAAIRANRISLTPIHFDLTDYTLLNNLQQWNKTSGRNLQEKPE